MIDVEGKSMDISGEGWKILAGSCLDRLKELEDNSIDAVVTDPPYELGFMGKSWDSSGIAFNVEVWAECLRVLKPGGHLLAFGGSRTWHRIAVAIEDAGFEVRDSIAWLYGSGFPKSLDISKAIDKRGGHGATLTKKIGEALREAREKRGISKTQADQMFCDGSTNWTWFEGRPAGQRPPTPETFTRIVAEWKELAPLAAAVAEAEREVIGKNKKADLKDSVFFGDIEAAKKSGRAIGYGEFDITAPATPEAQKWQGWGTALKPAFEPVVVARKPLTGTVAGNVLEWGVGGLNIDGTRIANSEGIKTRPAPTKAEGWGMGGEGKEGWTSSVTGRWPSNVMLDEFTAELVDQQSGISKDGIAVGKNRNSFENNGGMFGLPQDERTIGYGGSGGASRFFYVADTQKHDIMSPCKNTPANIVANYFKTIRAIIENFAQTTADMQPNEQLDQTVKSAGILCDSCATSIAHDLAALRYLAINKATSTHFRRYIKDCVNSTLSQNLALLVETWGNTDTTPTMTSFGRLFGCVLLATDENIRLENLVNGNAQTPFIYQAKASKRDRNEGLDGLPNIDANTTNWSGDGMPLRQDGTERKQPQKQNFHPTVKPTDLMRQLVRLVTPLGGIVLDPFTGSGSTGKAAILEGMQFIGCELTEDYLPIIQGRIDWAVAQVEQDRLKAEQESAEVLF